MNVLLIDNYDSFTYNLYQYVGELLEDAGGSFRLDVVRNDAITLQEIAERGYERIILSPGPGDPGDVKYFGVCKDVLLELGKRIPVLGVCLGMQGMAHYFGGRVIRAKIPLHGKTSVIVHDGKGVFCSLPQGIEGMRYHSLVADAESLPRELEISAKAITRESALSLAIAFESAKAMLADGKEGFEIMGLRHKNYPIEGIQFHPESFGTEGGKVMLKNFLFAPVNFGKTKKS